MSEWAQAKSKWECEDRKSLFIFGGKKFISIVILERVEIYLEKN